MTHRCNLRCRYCPVLHNSATINYNTAIIAIDLFLNGQDRKYLIKFSGGEPLLEFTLLKDIVIFARNKGLKLNKSVQFQITTNGILLNDAVINFFKKSKDIELIVSLDGSRNTQLKNRISVDKKLNSSDSIIFQKQKILSIPRVIINMVVAPNEVKKFYRNFLYILKLDFCRFIFLPAYFVYWNKEKINKLKKEFCRIAEFISKNKNRINIYVKNLDLISPAPLFNSGLVIDCNGDVFSDNLVLSQRFAYLRRQLRVGNIKDFSFKPFFFRQSIDINHLIDRVTPKSILGSTRTVDRVLTDFVNRLKNETS